jgi:hypothetical protein
MDRNNLKKIAISHVVELKFKRRDKKRLPKTRRMFCTLDPLLLNSVWGKRILNFRKPRNAPAYNAASKNLLFVWDIIMQDWRAVPMESCVLIQAVSTRPQKKFWEFFDKAIKNMTPQQKALFMDI